MRLVTFAVDVARLGGRRRSSSAIVSDAVDAWIPDLPLHARGLLAGDWALLSSGARSRGGGVWPWRVAPLATRPCWPRSRVPGKIVAVGRNYREHAAEEVPRSSPTPVLFTKYPSAVVGPGSDITWRAADRPRSTTRPNSRSSSAAARDVPPSARSTSCSATRASTTCRRATCRSRTGSGCGRRASTRSVRWVRGS